MIKISLDRKAAERRFGQIRSLDGTPDPIKQSARFFRAKIAEGFDAQRDPWGNRWAPLKDSTLRLRQARGSTSTRILDDTSRMRRSLRTRDDTVTIATPADFHQTGGAIKVFGRGRAWLPRRAIMPIDTNGLPNPPDSWMEQVRQFFIDFLRK